MFFFFFGLNSFAVTSAVYEEDVPLREQQEKAYKKFLENLKKKIPEGRDIPEEQVLILWKNLPHEKYEKQYLGHSDDWLLYMFGTAAASLMKKPEIYIDSVDTLYDEKTDDPVAAVLRRIDILREAAGTLPFFIENDFLYRLGPEEIPAPLLQVMRQAGAEEEREIEGIPSSHGLAAQELAWEMNRLFYQKFFDSLNGLLTQFIPPFDKDDTDKLVHQYFNWQSGKDSVKTCAARLNGISPPSFYRYISEFESSPLYAEYLKAYQHVLNGTKKQGTIPDCITFMSAYNKLEGDADRNKKLLEMFPQIAGTVDIPRIKLTSEKRIALLKRKGLYKKTLREHGLTSL